MPAKELTSLVVSDFATVDARLSRCLRSATFAYSSSTSPEHSIVYGEDLAN